MSQERLNIARRRAAIASLAVATILIAVKLYAQFLTGSVAILSSLVDSLLDLAASMVNFLAVRQALMPADEDHGFGHGKAEALGALGQAAFITGSAALLLIAASDRLVNPLPVAHSDIGIGVMVFSIILTLALVIYQRHVVRLTGSVTIEADSLHYVGDLLAGVAVIAALVLSAQFGWTRADPLLGIVVGAVILYSAWGIGRRAVSQLMDREMPESERERIIAIATAVPGVQGIHDLRTRVAGPHRFVQMHVDIDGSLSLRNAHAIADEVERQVSDAIDSADVIVHQDPVTVHPATSPASRS